MEAKEPFVSIIIPCRKIDSNTKECIKHCLSLSYANFEILLLPDTKPEKKELQEIKSQKLKIIATGKVKPAIKRNLGMKKSKAGIYAFIDSDAFPEKNWLKNAMKHLHDGNIGMVGGPNLTPPADNFKQKVSGMLLARWFCAGRTSIRYKIAKKREAVELPSCNFLVKKQYATKFEPDLLTAEDSKFCFNITKKGKKIWYAPDVIVYHHRREIFLPYLKQIWIYGRDIGMLLKRNGQFSFSRLYYSLLSLFILGVVAGGIISFFSPLLKTIYLSVILLYLAIALMSSISKNLKAIPFLFAGIIATHFAYGLGFLYGLVSKNKTGLNAR